MFRVGPSMKHCKIMYFSEFVGFCRKLNHFNNFRRNDNTTCFMTLVVVILVCPQMVVGFFADGSTIHFSTCKDDKGDDQ